MKFSIFALIFILASTTYALPQFIGTFKFNGELNLVNNQKREIVNTGYEQGVERLQFLKKSGFTCLAVLATTYKCSKNTLEPMPESVKNKILDRFAQLEIIFGQPLNDWELVSEGSHLTEYVLKQKTLIGEDVYYSSHYYKTPELNKLALKDEKGNSVWFNLDEEQLKMVFVEQKTISKNQFETYLIEAIVQK